MDLSSRIREAISHVAKSQADIAREAGITQSAITQWLSGSTKTLKAESAIALEKATGVRAAWIAKGVGPKFVEHAPSAGIPLPVLLVTWKQAAIWGAGINEQDADDLEAWVPSPVDHGDGAYALRVQGASMHNPTGPLSFADGDLIFVEPDIPPSSGSMVVAVLEGEDTAIFRQWFTEGSMQYLQALNPSWPDRILDLRKTPAKICGVVLARATILS